MKRLIILPCFAFLLFLIISVSALQTGTQISITIKGCDRVICDTCSRAGTGTVSQFCNCSELLPNPKIESNVCRGPDQKLGTTDDCGCPANQYCLPDTGLCTLEISEEDCEGDTWELCVTSGAGCWLNSSGVCTICPPPVDKTCSEYNEDACEADICSFGLFGPDSGICYAEGITRCGCHWNDGICEIGYTKMEGDEEIFCKLEQSLGDCVEGKALLETTEICTGMQPNLLPEKFIACGEAISPLPFFGLYSFIGVIAVIIIYYSFFKKNRR